MLLSLRCQRGICEMKTNADLYSFTCLRHMVYLAQVSRKPEKPTVDDGLGYVKQESK